MPPIGAKVHSTHHAGSSLAEIRQHTRKTLTFISYPFRSHHATVADSLA